MRRPWSNRLFFVVQAALKYLSFGWAVRLREVCYRPFFLSCGRNLKVLDGVTIKYPDCMSIGDDVRINEGCYLVALAGMTIGNDVMIGAGSKIATTRHITTSVEQPMARQGLAAEPIVIGDDVWFGFDVKVLSGATVGRGCILAAGAVVVSRASFAPFTIIGGVPAKAIGSRNGSVVTKEAE